MWSRAAALTVSVWVAEVSPVAAAVIVGEPATVSLYLKLPLEVPEAIVTEVIVAVSPVLRNRPPDELFVRFTVVFVEAVPGCPFVILNCTVIVPEVTPAVSVWALVVNASLVTGAAIAAGGEALMRMVAKRTAAGIVVIRRGKRLNTVKGLLSIGCTDRSVACRLPS